jgi:nitrogen fixation protein FixH
MSYIDWKAAPSEGLPPRSRSPWRFFPLAVVLSIGVVVAVNAGLIYAALHTFPGAAGDDASFALSNHYDTVLERAQRVATLGWVVTAATDDAGRVVVTLAARDGVPLHGASLSGTAERPLGTPQTYPVRFQEAGQGDYVADTPLPLPGQWDVTLSAAVGNDAMAVTRRVIVR